MLRDFVFLILFFVLRLLQIVTGGEGKLVEVLIGPHERRAPLFALKAKAPIDD